MCGPWSGISGKITGTFTIDSGLELIEAVAATPSPGAHARVDPNGLVRLER